MTVTVTETDWLSPEMQMAAVAARQILETPGSGEHRNKLLSIVGFHQGKERGDGDVYLESSTARETIDRYFGRPAEAVLGGIVVSCDTERDIYVDLDRRELRVGLKQEGWARLGRIAIRDMASKARAVLEIDLDDGGLRRFQSDTGRGIAGRGIADLVLDLIKRGVTCLAREYGYYTPKDKLAEQIDSLNTQLQAAKQAKQRAMIKARVTNTLGKRPWDNHT